jgi:hypothetical protein
MLSKTSRLLTYLLALLYAGMGVVLFLAPSWSAANFPWKISPFVAMTVGGWCLGNAFFAWQCARAWSWSRVYPGLIYLWAFGILEIAVFIAFREKLLLTGLLAWPYMLTLAANLLAAGLGIFDWIRLRPSLSADWKPAPAGVRASLMLFALFVAFLGLVGFIAPLGSFATEGKVFPEPLSLFTLRSFAAFYLSLSISAFFLARNPSILPVQLYEWGGLALIIPITAAAFVHIDKFDFSGRPGGIAYISAYLVAGTAVLLTLAYDRSQRSRAAGVKRSASAMIKTAETPLSVPAKIFFGFVALNALLGAVSLLLIPYRTSTFFFWEISPQINAAILGGFYLGATLTIVQVLRRGSWESARFLTPVVCGIGSLLALTTLIHLEKFIPGVRLVYWLSVYLSLPPLAILFYILHERRGANWQIVGRPVRLATRLLATGTALIAALFALGGFLIPGPFGAAAPFPIAPLMMRVIASWAGSFVPGLLWFWREPDWERVAPLANLLLFVAVFDPLLVLVHRADFEPGATPYWAIMLQILASGLIGLGMHWLQRQPAVSPARAQL